MNDQIIRQAFSPDEHAYWYGEIDEMNAYYESDTNYIGLSMEDLIAAKLVHAFCLGRSMEQEYQALTKVDVKFLNSGVSEY